MKFAITGADAITGDDRHLTLDAADQVAALAAAKSDGIFVSRVEPLPEPAASPVIPPPPPPPIPATTTVLAKQVAVAPLSVVFTVIAALNFLAAVIGGCAIGDNNPAAGWIVFASGCMGGLFLLALAKVLDYLFEAVQRLRQILRNLESKR